MSDDRWQEMLREWRRWADAPADRDENQIRAEIVRGVQAAGRPRNPRRLLPFAAVLLVALAFWVRPREVAPPTPAPPTAEQSTVAKQSTVIVVPLSSGTTLYIGNRKEP